MDINTKKRFAELIVKVGVNIKKGQEAVVYAELDDPDFVYTVVEEAYIAGASKVTVEWGHQPLTKLHVKYRSDEVITTVDDWEVEKLKHRRDTLPCMIYILSEDPDGLEGIDGEKYAKMVSARYQKLKAIRDEMENKYQWCIAAVPGKEWAKKVFPDLSEDQAVEKLWQAIIYTSRADGDPIKNWEEHNKELHKRADYLNSLGIKKLKYKASNGTDLEVGLIENSIFMGGSEETLSGNTFNANIPTEEIFISPKRGEAEGVVYSSKPFSYRGEIIENFHIEFKDGKAVEWGAEKGEKLLGTLINMDDGSHYLGECALVPFESPINKTGLLFYNTLFDENAACHLALGEGFSNTIKDSEKYTLEECRKMGINESMIHEDFMIGTEDLSIIAETRDGKTVDIFKNGTWAFSV